MPTDRQASRPDPLQTPTPNKKQTSKPEDQQASRPEDKQASETLREAYKYVSWNVAARPSVTILEQWGETAWLVSYDGPYASNRPRHIRLRKDTYERWPSNVRSGSQFELFELHKKRRAVMWKVRQLFWVDGTPAHFTVHYGPRPLGHFELVPPQAVPKDLSGASIQTELWEHVLLNLSAAVCESLGLEPVSWEDRCALPRCCRPRQYEYGCIVDRCCKTCFLTGGRKHCNWCDRDTKAAAAEARRLVAKGPSDSPSPGPSVREPHSGEGRIAASSAGESSRRSLNAPSSAAVGGLNEAQEGQAWREPVPSGNRGSVDQSGDPWAAYIGLQRAGRPPIYRKAGRCAPIGAGARVLHRSRPGARVWLATRACERQGMAGRGWHEWCREAS